MSRIAFIIAILALAASAAAAQDTASPNSTPSPNAAPSTSSAPPDGHLPIGAMRHEQPTQSDVMTRENQRYGSKKVMQQQSEEQKEVDDLYKQLMNEPIPAGK